MATEQESRDGTRKRLLRLHDGQLIESVRMPYLTPTLTLSLLLIREGLGHNANGRSLVMTPEFYPYP